MHQYNHRECSYPKIKQHICLRQIKLNGIMWLSISLSSGEYPNTAFLTGLLKLSDLCVLQMNRIFKQSHFGKVFIVLLCFIYRVPGH